MNSNNQISWNNGKEWLRQLVLLHSAMTIMTVIMSFIIFFISDFVAGGYESSPIPASGTIGTVIAFLGIIGSNFIYRSKLPGMQKTSGLDNKLLYFRRTSITTYAILEFACLINFIIAFISGNIYNIYIGLILVVFLYLKKPVKDKIFKDMMLSKEEIREFEEG
ncbi:MAG: hypothetical protein EA362_10030 [Saprospirales bacterium]|nr:MAG: hypothetical protein EA362_10030 [Saprospirales bacterium]